MSRQTFSLWLSSLISISVASPALAADVSYERKVRARDLTNQAVDLKGTANAQRGAELLWQAAALDPDNAVIQYDLGLAFAELKRYQEGWKCFQKAVVLDPSMADAWVQLGQAYADCGDFKRAAATVDDIKRRFPRDAGALANAEKLRVQVTMRTASTTKAGVNSQSLEIFRSEASAAYAYPIFGAAR